MNEASLYKLNWRWRRRNTLPVSLIRSTMTAGGGEVGSAPSKFVSALVSQMAQGCLVKSLSVVGS